MAWLLFGFILFVNPVLTWRIDIPAEFWGKQILHFLIMALIYYVNTTVLVPGMLIKKKIKTYTLCIFGILLLVQIFSNSYDYATDLRHLLTKAWGVRKHDVNFSLDTFMLLVSIMVIALSTSVEMFQHWQSNEEIKEESANQRVSAELLFLKSQINPHSFFNTLNTIYSLSFTDVERSREALLKLSSIMRYSLNKSEDDKTLISDEIKFIRDYVDLMKLRFRKPDCIKLEIEEESAKAYIAPMLLIPFIENAFKYGTGSEDTTSISIQVNQTISHFCLKVSNKIFKADEKASKNRIGIANTSRRLNLLYPDRHLLEFGKNVDDNTYNVYLEIRINET